MRMHEYKFVVNQPTSYFLDEAIASAATKAADLWIEFCDRPSDNGVDQHNALAAMSRKIATPDQKRSLHNILVQHYTDQLRGGKHVIELSTDYSPSPRFEELLLRAGMTERMVPWKTYVLLRVVGSSLEVSAKCGYGAQPQTFSF